MIMQWLPFVQRFLKPCYKLREEMYLKSTTVLPKELLNSTRTLIEKLVQTRENFLTDFIDSCYKKNNMELSSSRDGKKFPVKFMPLSAELRWEDVTEKSRSFVDEICHCALCRDGTYLTKRSMSEKKQKSSIRPNYFIALQISDPQIHSTVSEIQTKILEKCPDMKPAMIDIKTLHITTMVLHAEKCEESYRRLVTAMDKCQAGMRKVLGGTCLEISFRGLGSFRNNVLFASPQNNDCLKKLFRLAECISNEFKEQGIYSTDDEDKEFNPHLTILKLSKSPAELKRKGIKRVDPALYEEFADVEFGSQVFQKLQLCEMKRDENTGYYRIAYQVQFD